MGIEARGKFTNCFLPRIVFYKCFISIFKQIQIFNVALREKQFQPRAFLTMRTFI